MAKTVCKILGIVILFIGLAGFVSPQLLGAHLSPTHNVVRIVTGALAIYFGFSGSLDGARTFSLVIGTIYLTLGILGTVLGADSIRAWHVGPLMLSQVDHTIHVLLGVVFLSGGMFVAANYESRRIPDSMPASTTPIKTRSSPQSEEIQTQMPVYLGVSVPPVVNPKSTFVVRFLAYSEEYREHVTSVVELESPGSDARLDLQVSQWTVGTVVTVRLSATELQIKTGMQHFTWNGRWNVVHFDVEAADHPSIHAILKIDVAIDGMIIATLRPEIEITGVVQSHQEPTIMTSRAPRSAFASYSERDRRSVLARVRSLQIGAGIDVFLDCLSIRPGELWKSEISRQITDRDVFWLFWSRSARGSKWVEWEWRKALATKTLSGIQPHPLEPIELAPPPAELEDLQFETAYDSYLFALPESHIRRTWQRFKRILSRVRIISILIGWLSLMP